MKKEISKKILKGLLIGGAIYIGASSPYFVLFLARNIWRALGEKPSSKDDTRFKNAFYYLKRKGLINVQKRNHQIYISLTKEGRKRAGKYLIDDLKIQKPKKWDKVWRIIIFDIPDLTRLKRDAFRGKLRELGFYKLQQSVWVYPYPCQKEIQLLKEFFGLNSRELIIIEGVIEEDKFLRRFFNLS